jgi:hypothetical protein
MSNELKGENMTPLKHLIISLLVLGLGLAGTAGAKTYSLSNGSGGQLQIGGGLPLPIQAECNGVCTATVFPPLLIPKAAGAQLVDGTTVMTFAQELKVPKGVLSKPGVFKILGQHDNNIALYAVATNINFTWPVSAATFNETRRHGGVTTLIDLGGGESIRYSRGLHALERKFGGPAQFSLANGRNKGPIGGAGPPGNLNGAAAVTLYLIPPALRPFGNPPCQHPALGGVSPTGNACVAAIGNAMVTGLAAAGGGQPTTPTFVSTPGGTTMAFTHNGAFLGPKPGVGVMMAGTGPFHPAGPKGTVSLFAWTCAATGCVGAGVRTGFTNMASSSGFPWTTGKLTIKAANATGTPETWVLTGRDDRTTMGAGVIQMVSGALSLRKATGDNANRGWVRLDLAGPFGVPALSPASLAVTAGLMLLAGGYVMRRRLFS